MNVFNKSSLNFNSEIFTNQIENKTISVQNNDSNSEKINFTDVLESAINKVNDSQVIANDKVEGLIKGDENLTMHDVMLSMQEAQMSMQLMLEVRNNLYDAYKELSSVQL